MKQYICFLLLCTSALLYANKEEPTMYYFYIDKLIKEDQYKELDRDERKKVAYRFATTWKTNARKASPVETGVIINSGGINISINYIKNDRLREGVSFFKDLAASCKKQFGLKKKLRRSKIKFGGKKTYIAESKTDKGQIFQLMTTTFKDQRYYFVIFLDEKDMKLKTVRKAFFDLKRSFRFLQ